MALGPFHTIVMRSIPLPIFVLAGVSQFFIGPALRCFTDTWFMLLLMRLLESSAHLLKNGLHEPTLDIHCHTNSTSIGKHLPEHIKEFTQAPYKTDSPS